MSAKVLEQLKSEDFAVSVGFLSTAGALRRFLGRTSEVAAVRQSLREGAITENTIRGFVSALIESLRIGERLPHELALSALAVALETRPTDFADEFLRGLARLKLAELSLVIRVARECLKRRVTIAHRTAKSVDLADASEEMPLLLAGSQSTLGGNGCGRTNAHLVCEVQ